MNGNLLNLINYNFSTNNPDNLLDNPSGGAVDASGNIWFADYSDQSIREQSSSGQWMMTIGGGVDLAGDNDLNCSGYATSTTTARLYPDRIPPAGAAKSKVIAGATMAPVTACFLIP